MNVYDEQDRLVPAGRSEVEVMGKDPVVVQKMYGPAVFDDLRITADPDTYEWIVEREVAGRWVEVDRYPAAMVT